MRMRRKGIETEKETEKETETEGWRQGGGRFSIYFCCNNLKNSAALSLGKAAAISGAICLAKFAPSSRQSELTKSKGLSVPAPTARTCFSSVPRRAGAIFSRVLALKGEEEVLEDVEIIGAGAGGLDLRYFSYAIFNLADKSFSGNSAMSGGSTEVRLVAPKSRSNAVIYCAASVLPER